jgi:hypothetical protein
MFMKAIVALIFCTVSSTAQAQKIYVNTSSGTSILYDEARPGEPGGLPACNELLGDTESALGDATDEVAVLREELAVTVEALNAVMEELVAVYEENDPLEIEVTDLEDAVECPALPCPDSDGDGMPDFID